MLHEGHTRRGTNVYKSIESIRVHGVDQHNFLSMLSTTRLSI